MIQKKFVGGEDLIINNWSNLFYRQKSTCQIRDFYTSLRIPLSRADNLENLQPAAL